jgi:ubiquinone/menaquinone biosynthesis C-methylase UbiE
VTHLSDTPEGSLPLRAASIAAAAILGAREDVIAEAARVLKPAGCLAVLGSSPAREEAVLSLLRSAGLDPIVVDPQAIVARRV